MALAEVAMVAAGGGWCSAMAAVGGGPCRARRPVRRGRAGAGRRGPVPMPWVGGGCRAGGNAGRGGACCSALTAAGGERLGGSRAAVGRVSWIQDRR